MLCEEQHETPSNLYSSRDVLDVNEKSGENPLPTCMENTASEGRQEEGSFFQSEEIQKEIEELRRRDEEECRLKQQFVRSRIDQHLIQNGGDLSLLLSQHTVPNEVKCVQLTRFGQTKNIQSDKVPLPLPMKGDVLIRSHSCGVNFHDTMTRNGILDNWVRSTKPPFIMGSEVAGEIVGLGKNVTDLKLGDRVMALPERKAWSEYVVCREEYCFKIPDQMSYHEAVALTVDGIVSHSLLFQMGNLSPGKAVLLHSTPGGLGTLVTQMARTVPNTRIFKITAERMNGKHVESSDHAVHYIERDTDYVSEIRNSYPHGVDLVLDGLHESNFHRDFNLLSPMGKYVLFGNRTTNGGLFDTAKSVMVGAGKSNAIETLRGEQECLWLQPA
ncbi:synaptic vesicle membrane protein VAT-1 homolog-like [Daphnia pulicaria]|uniref:synaptic vesicle membrane protein VAT-1 homolog-like n=1 Tax=Daphnia pulicaria TaxID=35523 RepID=UPI001EEA2CD5|nr:synaptic vesicle membrane protein VAT-1 homolog-like [Daphnia pulicaria]